MRLAPLAVIALAMTLSLGLTAQAENGGRGQQFKLFDSAHDTVDPDPTGNPTNQVMVIDTTGGAIGGVVRKINPGTTISQLDNQVQLKYFLESRTCGGGSPRIQLGIDTDGDGTFDGNAFGYLGDQPFGGGCPSDTWVLEDMTNNQAKWDLSQLGFSMTNTWEDMETLLQTNFQNHRVVRGVLVDDSCSFHPPACGRAFFDNVVIGNQTINDHADTAGK